jgi:ribosome-associated heat shock protein Hsp15
VASDEPVSQRLDKWLWFVRLAKTRTLAAALVTGGKIRLNKVRVDKPAQSVKLGDVITAAVGKQVRILKVAGLGQRRGPAPEARTLYEELTPVADTPKPLARDQPAGQQAERAPGAGRPTKRDRRQLARLRGETP